MKWEPKSEDQDYSSGSVSGRNMTYKELMDLEFLKVKAKAWEEGRLAMEAWSKGKGPDSLENPYKAKS